MIGGLKKINVIPGKEKEFEELFNQLKAQVRKNEPGNEYYDLYRSQKDPTQYMVFERYKDQSALDLHKNSAHGALYFPKIRILLENIDVEYFDDI